MNGLGHLQVEDILVVILVDEHVGSIDYLINGEDAFESLKAPGLTVVSLALLQAGMQEESGLPHLRALESSWSKLHVEVGLKIGRVLIRVIVRMLATGVTKYVLCTLGFQKTIAHSSVIEVVKEETLVHLSTDRLDCRYNISVHSRPGVLHLRMTFAEMLIHMNLVLINLEYATEVREEC